MLVVLGIVNLRKNLEHEVDVPTEEKRNCCRNFVCCGNTNVHCTILSRVVRIVLGEVELCRMHMPSASLVRAETVQVLHTAVKEKVGANGCWRKCSPEPVMGGQTLGFCAVPDMEIGTASTYKEDAAVQHHKVMY